MTDKQQPSSPETATTNDLKDMEPRALSAKDADSVKGGTSNIEASKKGSSQQVIGNIRG